MPPLPAVALEPAPTPLRALGGHGSPVRRRRRGRNTSRVDWKEQKIVFVVYVYVDFVYARKKRRRRCLRTFGRRLFPFRLSFRARTCRSVSARASRSRPDCARVSRVSHRAISPPPPPWARREAWPARRARRRAAAARARGVHLGHHRAHLLLELPLLVLHLVHLREPVRVHPVDGLLDRLLDRVPVLGGQVREPGRLLVANRLPRRVRVLLERVPGFHLFLFASSSAAYFPASDHALDVLLGEPAFLVGDGDGVLGPGGLVLGGDVQNAVRVQVEAHADLRHAAGRRRDARELERAQQVVVARHRARPRTPGWSPLFGCPST